MSSGQVLNTSLVFPQERARLTLKVKTALFLTIAHELRLLKLQQFCTSTGWAGQTSPPLAPVLYPDGRTAAERLALQVGGEVRSTKILTKNYLPILRSVLNAAERISQFFQRLLTYIFDIQKTRSQSKTSSWRSIHSKLEAFLKSGVANFSPL